MFVADDYAARVIANDPVAGPILAEQYRAAGLPVPMLVSGIETAASTARPYIPGSDAAPSLDALLGPPPTAPSDATVSPSGAMPTFGASVNQLDTYRIAFLIAGVVIGYVLFTKS